MTVRVVSLLSMLVLALSLTLMALAQAPAKSAAYVLPYRIVHFVLRGVSLETARGIVDTAKDSGFNAIQVTLSDGVVLEKSPWTPRKDAWSKAEFLTWVAYARSRGLEVIPEIQLLTHQEKFFQDNYPELMFNVVTYDPRKEGVYRLVFPFLDEIIAAIHPNIIHIGHDEAIGWNNVHAKKVLKPGEMSLPADLFLQDVLRIHGYLKSKGISMWMWGDMLLAPSEFTAMLDNHLHGVMLGYGKKMRDRLPKDIVITDWHYFDNQADYPSMDVMQREGFKVIGSTWKKEAAIRNFTRYAHDHNAYGMMATTWFHVQRKDMDLVEWIIRTSGKVYQDTEAAVTPFRGHDAYPDGWVDRRRK